MNILEEHKIGFLILIGLPASGKTTFCSYLAQYMENASDCNDLPFQCLIQVCYDEIITPCSNMQWKKARNVVSRKVENMVGNLKICTDLKKFAKQHNLNVSLSKTTSTSLRILIIIDDNMYYRSMRYHYYQIARSLQLSYCQLYFKCNVQECLRRNSQRSGEDQIAEHIICKMALNLEEPNNSIHPWEMFSTSLTSDVPFNHTSFVSLFECISDAFSHPVESIPQNSGGVHSPTCSLNVVHQADLVLRKIIGSILRERKQHLDQRQIKLMSICLNNKRQNLLQEIKSGKLHPPEDVMKGIEEGHVNAISSLYSLLATHFVHE